jgi:hypothetical protein
MREKQDLLSQASSKYRNYGGNIEADEMNPEVRKDVWSKA